MEHKIKIYYSTGNSFGSSEEISYLDLTWKNVEIAKENLKRIKEHYIQYQELNSYSMRKNKTRLEIMLSNKDKEWFIYKPILVSKLNGYEIRENAKEHVGDGNWEYVPDTHFAEYCLKLKTDDGKEMQISAFWCGYFETLYSAEIEIDNSDLIINF